MLYNFKFIMFKTLIILHARNFWVIEGRPKRGRSFPHWLAPMIQSAFICRCPNRLSQSIAWHGRDSGFFCFLLSSVLLLVWFSDASASVSLPTTSSISDRLGSGDYDLYAQLVHGSVGYALVTWSPSVGIICLTFACPSGQYHDWDWSFHLKHGSSII